MEEVESTPEFAEGSEYSQGQTILTPEDFKLDKNDLDTFLENLGNKIYQQGELLVKAVKVMNEKESRLKQVKAAIALAYRGIQGGAYARAVPEGIGKNGNITDAQAKDLTEVDAEVIKTSQEYTDARYDVDTLRNSVESLRALSYNASALKDLYRDGYFIKPFKD